MGFIQIITKSCYVVRIALKIVYASGSVSENTSVKERVVLIIPFTECSSKHC